MYEIAVGRELRDEKSIGVTPDFAADADRAAIIDCVGRILRDAISLCANWLFINWLMLVMLVSLSVIFHVVTMPLR